MKNEAAQHGRKDQLPPVLMGFLGLLFTAALCIFVFHKAFTAQAWTSLEREADLVSAGYDLVQDPQQLRPLLPMICASP